MLQQPALLGGELRDGERLGLCAFQAFLSLGAYRALGAVECVECRLAAVVVPVGHRALAHRQVPVGADEHVRVLVEGEAVAPVYPGAEVGMRRGEQLGQPPNESDGLCVCGIEGGVVLVGIGKFGVVGVFAVVGAVVAAGEVWPIFVFQGGV